jgi:sugar phosphate isomerase/epimerase
MQAPDMLQLASDVGFDSIGVRLATTGPSDPDSLLANAALQRETVTRMRATGVPIFDVEVVRIGPGFEAGQYRRFLDVAAIFGAAAVLVIAEDRDERRLMDGFGELCELAAPHRIDIQLEFMPWTAVPDARTAQKIISSVGKSNAKILVDTLHVARSSTTLDDLSAIPPGMIRSVQICDGKKLGSMSADAMMKSARYERLLPGEGDVDIQGMLLRLPANIPIGVEVPNSARLAEVGPASWTKQALAASRRVVGRARSAKD